MSLTQHDIIHLVYEHKRVDNRWLRNLQFHPPHVFLNKLKWTDGSSEMDVWAWGTANNQKVWKVIKEHVTCLLSQCNCATTPSLGYQVKKMLRSCAVIWERLVNFSSDLGNYDPDPIQRCQRSYSLGLSQCILFVESGPLFLKGKQVEKQLEGKICCWL